MKPKKPISEDAMRLRLADLCSHTEQCAYDLREKMRRAGISPDAAQRILEALKQHDFLNESRYAAAYARDKVRFSGWGKMKIRMGLMAKRISDTDISDALGSIDRKEYIDAFKRVTLAKARTLDMASTSDVQKLYRHLASRGFESSLISKVVGRLRKD